MAENITNTYQLTPKDRTYLVMPLCVYFPPIP
jgi:hypothetical protein